MFMKCKVTVDTSHYPKEGHFEVPEGWAWCNFTEVADLISGQDFPPEKYNSNAQGTPYIIGASNIEKGCLKINRWTEYPSVLSQKGDVLVVCKGAGVGKVAVNDLGIVHIARQIQAVRIQYDIVSSDFMRILIDWCVPSIVSQANGLIPGLKRELLQGVLLPIPPQNEQERIVSTVCEAYAIIDDLEVKKEQIESYIKKTKEQVLDLAIHGKLVPQDASDEPSIKMLRRMNPAFKPSDNLHYDTKLPVGWCLARLEEVAEYGDTSNVDVASIATYNWVLELEDIEKDTAFILEKKNKAAREISGVRHSFRKGQVLYSKLRTYLNKVLIAPEDGFCTTEIVPITASKALLSEYLLIVLRSPYFLKYTASCVYGVKMPRLGTNDAKKAIIPIPPLAEQVRIVKKVSDLMKVISLL